MALRADQARKRHYDRTFGPWASLNRPHLLDRYTANDSLAKVPKNVSSRQIVIDYRKEKLGTDDERITIRPNVAGNSGSAQAALLSIHLLHLGWRLRLALARAA
jgi:hypothetical protein